jgi:hypothetical protein
MVDSFSVNFFHRNFKLFALGLTLSPRGNWTVSDDMRYSEKVIDS